jgi:DnaK suppressor protein
LGKGGVILAVGDGVQRQISMDSNTRQGDPADQVTGTNEVYMPLKVQQAVTNIIQAIEEALWRMKPGTYGICCDCGEEIALARLNAIVGLGLYCLQGAAEFVA